jgi:MFS family permease
MNKKKEESNIISLGSASLFNDIGSEMISPILPFYILSLGGGGIAVGLISGLRDGMSSLMKLLGGWLSDKTGKRMPFVFLGYIISVLSRFLLLLSNSWQAVVFFVSLERFGKSRDAPRDAIISVSTDRRGWGFAMNHAMDTVGAIIGTIIVLFLFWKFNLGFKQIIILAGIISAISIIPLFFVKEPKTKPIKKNLFGAIKSLKKNLKYFIFVASVFTIANFGLYMFMLLRAKEITGSTIGALAVYILFNASLAAFSVPFGKLSDKIGRKKILIAGYLVFLAVSIGFIFCNNLVALLILFICYGLVYAMVQSNQRALVSDLANGAEGTAMGVYHATTGFISIPAGIIAGALWNVGYAVMFSYISIVAIISLILLMFVKE